MSTTMKTVAGVALACSIRGKIWKLMKDVYDKSFDFVLEELVKEEYSIVKDISKEYLSYGINAIPAKEYKEIIEEIDWENETEDILEAIEEEEKRNQKLIKERPSEIEGIQFYRSATIWKKGKKYNALKGYIKDHIQKIPLKYRHMVKNIRILDYDNPIDEIFKHMVDKDFSTSIVCVPGEISIYNPYSRINWIGSNAENAAEKLQRMISREFGYSLSDYIGEIPKEFNDIDDFALSVESYLMGDKLADTKNKIIKKLLR